MIIIKYRHEITGIITKVGSDANGFKEGDRVGVGCLAASCLDCEYCKTDQENYCEKLQFVYNGIFWDGSITYGGYSQMLVVDYRYIIPLFIFIFLNVYWFRILGHNFDKKFLHIEYR
jgi:D-arabinose 1-dehydrogenase-like Zn-dependent alcohol dehydrogenase